MPDPIKGTLITNLGDANPLDYGGHFVYRMPDGSHEAWYWQEPPEEGNDEGEETYYVYHWDIPKDVLKELNWVKDWGAIAETMGIDEAQLRQFAQSADPSKRASVIEMVGSYWGYEELDSCPNEYTREEMEQLFDLGDELPSTDAPTPEQFERAIPSSVKSMRLDEAVDELLLNACKQTILMALYRAPTHELSVDDEALQRYLSIEDDGFWDALEELEDAGKVEVIHPLSLDDPTRIKGVFRGPGTQDQSLGYDNKGTPST